MCARIQVTLSLSIPADSFAVREHIEVPKVLS
jgi:hypothetical protein